jgi:hypothetical protein
MDSNNHAPQINWSVWDRNPVVSWSYERNVFTVALERPPLSVSDLPGHSLIAIVGHYDDFGSENLLLYTYNGLLKKKLAAPNFGLKAHFGRVSENHDKLSAVVGFFDKAGWVEREGLLDITDGSLALVHRTY